MTLLGTGTYADLPILYPGLLYSTTNLGSKAQQNVQFTNTGPTTLNISKIQTIGDFSETDNCGSGLNAGSSCQITVTFTPTATGFRRGNLVITDSDPGSPHMGRLTGTATAVDRQPHQIFLTAKVGETSRSQDHHRYQYLKRSALPSKRLGYARFHSDQQLPDPATRRRTMYDLSDLHAQETGTGGRHTHINDADLTSPQSAAWWAPALRSPQSGIDPRTVQSLLASHEGAFFWLYKGLGTSNFAKARVQELQKTLPRATPSGGHEFTRAAKSDKYLRASAPESRFFSSLLGSVPFALARSYQNDG